MRERSSRKNDTTFMETHSPWRADSPRTHLGAFSNLGLQPSSRATLLPSTEVRHWLLQARQLKPQGI